MCCSVKTKYLESELQPFLEDLTKTLVGCLMNRSGGEKIVSHRDKMIYLIIYSVGNAPCDIPSDFPIQQVVKY